jgi:hypothetical protein
LLGFKNSIHTVQPYILFWVEPPFRQTDIKTAKVISLWRFGGMSTYADGNNIVVTLHARLATGLLFQ